MHAWRTRNQRSLAQERNVAVVSDSPPPRLASYTGDHVGCGRPEEGLQGEMQIGYEGGMSSILHFGSARQESWLSLPGWLYTLADIPSPSPLLCKTNDPKGRMFGHLDKAALEKQNKTGICFTLKPPSCEGLVGKATSLAFV